MKLKMEDTLIKILFRFYSDILEEETSETMWATIVDEQKGLYKIDNIPFYAFIACEDVVFAEYDEDEQMITYRETVEYSGNSTIHVVLLDEKVDVMEIRNSLKTLNCESEGLNKRYFALEIPKSVGYSKIKDILKDLEKKDILSYSETCLANAHWDEVYSPG